MSADSSSYPSEVLQSTRGVAQRARHVTINQGAAQDLARQWAAAGLQVPQWDRTYHYSGPPELTANYLLVLDSINFCFWGDPRWEIEYRGEKLSGYWALAASLTRAVEEGLPILEADFLASIQESEAAHLFRGVGIAPLLRERARILRDVGRALQDKYHGQFDNLVRAAGSSAPALVELVVKELPHFHDVAHYRNQKVRFYKRAQILVADLWGAFDGAGLGALSGIAELTAFADYKLPQVLRELGVLEYSQDLARDVDSLMPLEQGGEKEVEIRSCVIWAVESIKEALKQEGVEALSFQIDWRLWELGQSMALSRPHHRTITIYY